MNDYKSAFNAMAADIGAIIALLGFSKYPGVDPVLRAITDLVLAKAETEGLRAERDVALAAVDQLHSMLGVTDQVQAGERIGFLVGQSIMVPKLEARIATLEKAAVPVEIDWPEYHSGGMGCGLEDRGITDRYEAMRYGWDQCMERCGESLDGLHVYSAPATQILAGYALIPERMTLDKEVIESVAFHCGDGAESSYGEYQDGILFIGTIEDDDGRAVHGLHIACAECEEEGYSTLVEFAAPAQGGAS